jgi:CRP/FNR family transcriptional regulator, cyclic AMP receptor protein
LTQTEADYLALLLRAGDATEYRAGDVVFSEGDGAEQMYIVRSGSVALRKGDRELELVGVGGMFGEMALIDRELRSASAIAETDSELVVIEKRRFWFLVQETPYFAQLVMRVMVDRLRKETARERP